MRRITLVIVGTIVGLVLLFSYRTSTSGSTTSSTAARPGVVRSANPAPSGTSSSTNGSSSGSTIANGSAENNGYGTVQVRVRISGGRIANVSTLSLPTDPHSRQINAYAVPELRKEVLKAQSAHVNTVSGATLTSEAYLTSVQAALDAAHFNG